MIGLLHGYLLEGSGSNLWTRSVVRALCREGETVHLFCQENHPERYDFIAEAHCYGADGERQTLFSRETPYQGHCIMHRPDIGETLPVYVPDDYEEFSRVVPMTELSDDVLENYIARNVETVQRVVEEQRIRVLHANHAVLMSVVAHRVARAVDVPFVIMPHGSAIEYAVRRDARFQRWAAEAFGAAARILTIGPELRNRVRNIFSEVRGVETKLFDMPLGADTGQFRPVERSERGDAIARLGRRLETLRDGRSPSNTDALRQALEPDMTLEAFRTAVEAAEPYDLKSPDRDLPAKLQQIDWDADEVALFVGRLIGAKGLPGVLAAVPRILERHPRLRLLVCGHGPLREPMEAFVQALQQGDGDLLQKIAAWGTALEGADAAPFEPARRYFEQLKARGEFESYLATARAHVRTERIVFTGYLSHPELCLLFPCCDVAVFPSVVAEAGPLVFLEALASGCFPLGTYFGGMAASIDAASEVLPGEDAAWMRLRPDDEHTVADIAENVSGALALDGRHRATLRDLAVERYDWQGVARRMAGEFRALTGPAGLTSRS